jgi:hypothetical protein
MTNQLASPAKQSSTKPAPTQYVNCSGGKAFHKPMFSAAGARNLAHRMVRSGRFARCIVLSARGIEVVADRGEYPTRTSSGSPGASPETSPPSPASPPKPHSDSACT